MIFDKEGNTTIVFQEKGSLGQFVSKLREAYPRIENDHLIINLFSLGPLTTTDLVEFLEFSNHHRSRDKSFVLVSEGISYEQVPDELSLAPTLQEARDIIEMEEIERDLDL